MTHKAFKKESSSIKQRFIARRRLLRPFVRLYGNPVIVHAVDRKAIFKKILGEGKLKLPKEHSTRKKAPFMERILKIDNGIYYSLGFVYLTAYDWKYNLVFDISFLKNLIYYEYPVNYRCYTAVVNYWYEKDRAYLEKLANTNRRCREVVDKYYYSEYKGKKRTGFDFWKIERYVFDFIQKYPKRKELEKIVRKTAEKLIKDFPASLRDAKKAYLSEKTPEIVGLKETDLLRNPYFLGFHINGKIPNDIMAILKRKYADKIMFDGARIRKISDL